MVKLSVFGKRKHVFDLLNTMDTHPARFTALRNIARSEKTLSYRLKDFKENGLIKREPVITKERPYVGYGLTPKGRKFLGLINKIKKL